MGSVMLPGAGSRARSGLRSPRPPPQTLLCPSLRTVLRDSTGGPRVRTAGTESRTSRSSTRGLDSAQLLLLEPPKNGSPPHLRCPSHSPHAWWRTRTLPGWTPASVPWEAEAGQPPASPWGCTGPRSWGGEQRRPGCRAGVAGRVRDVSVPMSQAPAYSPRSCCLPVLRATSFPLSLEPACPPTRILSHIQVLWDVAWGAGRMSCCSA